MGFFVLLVIAAIVVYSLYKKKNAANVTPKEEKPQKTAEEIAAEKEEAAAKKMAAEAKKAEQKQKAIDAVLKPTCDKGDCLWHKSSFYFTCPHSVECQRKKVTKRNWGDEISNPQVWPYLKRYEAIDNAESEGIKHFETHETLAKDLMEDLLPRFKGYERAFQQFQYHGIAGGFNNHSGNFFNLLWDLRDTDVKPSYEMMQTLVNGFAKSGGDQPSTELHLNYDFYRNPSLYQRTDAEFLYTVNIFEKVLDTEKLSEYFKDISNISIDQLMDENGNIKPAGIGGPQKGHYGDTIWNTVESWSGDDGDNEVEK